MSRISMVGDSALRVELGERIVWDVNGRAIAIARAIERAAIPGVRDVVPTFCSLNVYFDPLRTDYDALVARLEGEIAAAEPVVMHETEAIRVPVCYDPEYAPDLDGVAEFAGLAAAEVVQLHAGRTYRVFMLGFVPGFAYMGIVDERIAAPRLSTPRVRVPLGAVGIAGGQTGVYSAATPGGWRIIGRTPMRPFDLTRADPFLFKPGDAVQFYAIDGAEFTRWKAA